MNYIALTGRDMPAMAQAAEILLECVTRRRVAVAIFLDVNDYRTAEAVRSRLHPGEHGELWRIGPDAARPEMSQLVDAHLPSAERRHIARALRSFVQRLPALRVSMYHPKPETTV